MPSQFSDYAQAAGCWKSFSTRSEKWIKTWPEPRPIAHDRRYLPNCEDWREFHHGVDSDYYSWLHSSTKICFPWKDWSFSWSVWRCSAVLTWTSECLHKLVGRVHFVWWFWSLQSCQPIRGRMFPWASVEPAWCFESTCRCYHLHFSRFEHQLALFVCCQLQLWLLRLVHPWNCTAYTSYWGW